MLHGALQRCPSQDAPLAVTPSYLTAAALRRSHPEPHLQLPSGGTISLLADARALTSLAHQLKGAAGGYGFGPISDAARAVEQTALSTADSAANAGALSMLISRCRAAIRGGTSASPTLQ